MVCEKKDGHMASPMSYSACTCFQDILAEVEENGEGLQEIMDVIGGGSGGGGGSVGGGSGGESGVIQTPNYPDFYPASSYEVIKEYKYWHNHTVTIALLGVESRGRLWKADQAHI